MLAWGRAANGIFRSTETAEAGLRAVFARQIFPKFCLALALIFSPLALQPAAAEGQKVLVIIDEKVMGVLGTTGSVDTNEAELTIMRHLSGLGMRPLDPATVKRNVSQTQGLRLLEGDDKAAAAVGLQHGAAFSVVGNAISKPSGAKLYGTQIKSIQATVTARVVRNDDGRVIAHSTATANHPDVDEVRGGTMAIQQAAQTLAEDLGRQMTWAGAVRGPEEPQQLLVNISGLVSYRHLDFVMRFLEEKVPGVQTVALENYTSGNARIALDYSGQMRELARACAMQKFNGFRLEPTHVAETRLDIKAVLEQ